MQKNQTKIDCGLLSPVEVYQLILVGKLKRFPNGFWCEPDGEENAGEILQYLFESLLQWSFQDIKQKIYFKIFNDYKLQGMAFGFISAQYDLEGSQCGLSQPIQGMGVAECPF